MPSVLISGASRGLGLEWARQYAGAGWRVFASARHPLESRELQALAAAHDNLTAHRLDVTRDDEIRALAWELAEEPLDLLVNNAGAYFEKYVPDGLGRIRYDHWGETFRVNTLGPVRVTEAFVEHLARGDGRLVAAITSHMGSIHDITAPGDYAYRSSKAALNAAMKGLAHELEPRGIGVLLLHPGWVRTRMGGPDGRLDCETSVRAMRELVAGYTPAWNARFLRYDGTEIPW
jgi:NAD(P)-dependent dehydrogenase (short-subunit alcohol dehydrogenase family)